MVTPREFDIKLGGHQSALVHDESRSFAAYIKETELIRRVWWTNYHSLHISNVDVTTGHSDCWNEIQISGAMRNYSSFAVNIHRSVFFWICAISWNVSVIDSVTTQSTHSSNAKNCLIRHWLG